MAIPISEKASCVWCHENPPCAKVGFSFVYKPLLERNILFFCRGVYALFCLIWVNNQMTNPHLSKVKDRSLGLVITNLFSARPFSFWRVHWPLKYNKAYCSGLFVFPSWSDFPCCVADSAFSSAIWGALVPHQSVVLHSSVSVQRKLCLGFFNPGVLSGGELSFL